MLCSGGKTMTKLLVVSTKVLRNRKMEGRSISVTVGNNIVHESSEEKLLGIIMSNNLSWNAYLYGCENVVGLIPKLSQRIGMLSKLNKFMSRQQFKMTCDGMFTSTLLYCLPLYVNTWGVPSLDDTVRHSSAFTKEDCRRLQVLQNKVLNCQTQKYHHRTSTKSLLEETSCLSVHQLGAYHTLVTTARILLSEKPEYFVNRFNIKNSNAETIVAARQVKKTNISCNLSISRSGFLYRAEKLWNCLPTKLRCETKITVLKAKLRNWVQGFITVKPS